MPDLPAYPQDPAICINCDFDAPNLVTFEHRCDKALTAILDPLQRCLEQKGRCGNCQFFRVEYGLRTEASTDIRGDHPNLMLR
jgi:hypothetical protein